VNSKTEKGKKIKESSDKSKKKKSEN
jgi:hypothetical protein